MSEREPGNLTTMGPKRYRDRIHSESKKADLYKNLPYKFSKPAKDKPRSVVIACADCGRDLAVTEDTRVVVCGACNCFNRISKESKV